LLDAAADGEAETEAAHAYADEGDDGPHNLVVSFIAS
jgi:hypothetical protein